MRRYVGWDGEGFCGADEFVGCLDAGGMVLELRGKIRGVAEDGDSMYSLGNS